jgi:hypothetical protein
VETRRYATARSIDHTAYHRMQFGRSGVQSNVVAVFMSHSDVGAASGICAQDKSTQPIPKATDGRTFAIAMPPSGSAEPSNCDRRLSKGPTAACKTRLRS